MNLNVQYTHIVVTCYIGIHLVWFFEKLFHDVQHDWQRMEMEAIEETLCKLPLFESIGMQITELDDSIASTRRQALMRRMATMSR